MLTIQHSSKYLRERKRFLKNNPGLLSRTIKSLKLLSQNPKHPGLHLEKLKGQKIWTIRVDRGNRIFLSSLSKDTVILLDIGKHDKYREL